MGSAEMAGWRPMPSGKRLDGLDQGLEQGGQAVIRMQGGIQEPSIPWQTALGEG
jgi:hypothetical protein